VTQPALSHPSEILPWFVNGTLEGEELRDVEEHLRSCLTCRREVKELRELRRGVQRAAPQPPPGGLERLMDEVGAERRGPGPPRSGIRFWRPLATGLIAATMMAAVGLGIWRPWSPQKPQVAQRAGNETELLRSLVDPEQTLPRQAFVLSWEVEPTWQDARFSVIVTREDLTPVAEAYGLEETRYEVPAEALAALPAGARLFWRVEAVRPDGTRFRSPTFRVSLD
jgi:anti-sigma factor RsiW